MYSSDFPAFTPVKADTGTRFSDSGGMWSGVDLVGGYIGRVYPPISEITEQCHGQVMNPQLTVARPMS